MRLERCFEVAEPLVERDRLARAARARREIIVVGDERRRRGIVGCVGAHRVPADVGRRRRDRARRVELQSIHGERADEVRELAAIEVRDRRRAAEVEAIRVDHVDKPAREVSGATRRRRTSSGPKPLLVILPLLVVACGYASFVPLTLKAPALMLDALAARNLQRTPAFEIERHVGRADRDAVGECQGVTASTSHSNFEPLGIYYFVVTVNAPGRFTAPPAVLLKVRVPIELMPDAV